jgi:cyanophycinase
MSGTLALVGSGEFTTALERVDRCLLEATGRPRPRVAVVPTASAPEGEAVFLRWAEMGSAHFGSLGAEVEQVLVRTRADANDAVWEQAIGEADLVYLSGGKPGALQSILDGTRVGAAILDAHRRGAVVAGCSAGAVFMGERLARLRRRPRFLRWDQALGLVPGTIVAPHSDAFPEPFLALLALQAPRGFVVVGIDQNTALIGRDGIWQVMGPGRVTLWRGRHRIRYREGDLVRM